jgi:hypothetical protein
MQMQTFAPNLVQVPIPLHPLVLVSPASPAFIPKSHQHTLNVVITKQKFAADVLPNHQIFQMLNKKEKLWKTFVHPIRTCD